MKNIFKIGIGCLAFLLTFLVIFFKIPSITYAAWSDNWQYRKRITITGQSGAGTNFQVKLNVGESDSSSGADFSLAGNTNDFPATKNDSGDLLFTDNDGSTALDFWVESVSGTAPNRTATVWVEVADSLETDVDIYIYYNNDSATNISNGTNTFILFDDFEGSSLDSSIWNSQKSAAASFSISNSQITFTNTNITDYVWIDSVNTLTYPVWSETKVDTFDPAGTTYRMGHTTAASPRGDNGNLYNEYSADGAGGKYRIVGDSSLGGWEVSSTSAGSDTSGIWSFSWNANSSQFFLVDYVSKLTGNDSSLSIGNYYMYLGNAASGAGTSIIDWARVRKFLATQPSFSSIANQETYPTPTPTPAATPTPSATPTPTPTPAVSTTQGISTVVSSSDNSQTCSDIKPNKKLDLFEIDTGLNTATLYFTPSVQTNKYYISYSKSPDAQEHGAEVTLSSLGVQKFTVELLNASETYYFKVRPQNGCMPGPWSDIKKAATKSNSINNAISKIQENEFEDELVINIIDDENNLEDDKKTIPIAQVFESEPIVENKQEEKRINILSSLKTSLASLSNSLSKSLQKTGIALNNGINTLRQANQDIDTSIAHYISNISFKTGEKAQYISDQVGLGLIQIGYNLVSEPTQIYDVQVEILSESQVKISWFTNQPATGKVNYGFDETYGFDIQSSKLHTYHEFILNDLHKDKIYYFEVMSQGKMYVYDANRKFVISSN